MRVRKRATGLLLGVGVLFLIGTNVQAFDACHVLSSLSTRAQRRCRVIAGTATVTDAVEKPALMAGAANVTLFPFTLGLFESELGRLEERLGPRKTLRRA